MRPFPGRRSVVIMDNASIHKSRRLRRMIERRGGRLLFTPPYAFDRTPLDNGAFGLVVRFLKNNSPKTHTVKNWGPESTSSLRDSSLSPVHQLRLPVPVQNQS